MRNCISIFATLILITGCSSIGQSRLNPFNWFGGVNKIQTQETQNGLIPEKSFFSSNKQERYLGTPVYLITSLRLLPAQRGEYILQVNGQAKVSDVHTLRLIELPSDNPAILRYSLRAIHPDSSMNNLSNMNKITTAHVFERKILNGIRKIEVSSESNTLEISR